MSGFQEAEVSPTVAVDATPIPGRSAWRLAERIFVRGLILGLLVLLAVELRASLSYSRSLRYLKAQSDHNDGGLPMSAVDENLPMMPARNLVRKSKAEQTWDYSWFSVVKNGQYSIKIVSGADEPVDFIRFYTGKEDGFMDVHEPTADEVVPLPPGGLGFGTMGGGPPPDESP